MALGESVRSRSRFFEYKIQTLSSARKEGIKISLKHFDEFAKKNYDGQDADAIISSLKQLPESKRDDKLFEILQEWINYLHSKGLVSIRIYFSGFNRYLRYHKIKLTKEDIKDELTFPKKIEEEKYSLSIDDIHTIFKVAKYKKQGFYLAMLTSGMRPSEALSLRKKDVQFLHEMGHYMITIPPSATKLKRQRTVIVSKEVNPYLSKALNNLENDDLVWARNKITKSAVSNEDDVFASYCEKVGITKKFETTGYNKINLTCFRSYYYSKASKIHGDEYAHKMMGHHGYLPQYDRKSLEDKLEMYEELEPELFVFDLTKKDEKIKKLTDANNEIEKIKVKVLKLEKIREREDKVSSDLVSFYETGDKNYLKNFPPKYLEYWRMWKALKALGKKPKTFSWPLETIPEDIKKLAESN